MCIRDSSPEDGQAMGLQGMIDHMLNLCDVDPGQYAPKTLDGIQAGDWRALARLITALENGTVAPELRQQILREAKTRAIPVLGITGTGGSGKSSLTDELVRRFRLDQDDRLNIAVIAADPSRRKTGGALLGDRIRMNAVAGPNLYMRSLATRATGSEVPETLGDILALSLIHIYVYKRQPRNSPTTSIVITSLSVNFGAKPRWRRR